MAASTKGTYVKDEHDNKDWEKNRHKHRLVYKISYRCEECEEDLDFYDDDDQDCLGPEAYCKMCWFRCGKCRFYFKEQFKKIERAGKLKHRWCEWCYVKYSIPDDVVKEPEVD